MCGRYRKKNENILVMMDSHSQSLDYSKLAAAFPTSIFSYFKASNSTSSWPGARFPESSHSARAPWFKRPTKEIRTKTKKGLPN